MTTNLGTVAYMAPELGWVQCVVFAAFRGTNHNHNHNFNHNHENSGIGVGQCGTDRVYCSEGEGDVRVYHLRFCSFDFS